MKNQIKLLLCAASLVAAQSYGQNLVQNPGFETGDFTAWTLTGQTSPYLNVYVSGQDYFSHTGNYYVDFGPTGPSGNIGQVISDTVGASYVYSFWVAGNGSGESYADGYWDGNLVIATADPIAQQGYVLYSTTVVGTGSDLLQIDLFNGPSFDALDDVSLVGVPDSGSTMAMMSLGLVGLGGVARRFRR